LFCELLFLICIAANEKYEFKCAIHYAGDVTESVAANQSSESGFKKHESAATNQKRMSVIRAESTDARPVIRGFRNTSETDAPQQLQPVTSPAVSPESKPVTPMVNHTVTTKIVGSDITNIKRRISTLNSRIRPKSQGNPSGYATEPTYQNRLLQLQEAISELEVHGITAIINYEKQEPVKYQVLTT
jgi:flagellum-specific peptidoglycan hydrolase FlgJ